jgi:hypothetical protein
MRTDTPGLTWPFDLETPLLIALSTFFVMVGEDLTAVEELSVSELSKANGSE